MPASLLFMKRIFALVTGNERVLMLAKICPSDAKTMNNILTEDEVPARWVLELSLTRGYITDPALKGVTC